MTGRNRMSVRVAASIAAAAAPALAQCSMCRTALETHSGDVFNRAILILLLPAMAIFSGAFLLFFRLQRTEKDDRLETGSQFRQSADAGDSGEE